MRAAAEEQGAAVAERLGAAAGEVAADFRSQAVAGESDPAVPDAAGRQLSGPERERFGFRESGVGEEPSSDRKSLQTFDLKRLPAKATRQFRTLLDGSFLDRKENVLVFGNPGSGKSHLLTALAQELVVARERKMHFTKCALLMQDLLAAKRDLRLSREIKRLGRYDGLIIDDLGYLQQSRDDMEVVFTLLAERYERGSVLMTSNLPFSKWEAIFKDAMMTAAAIDRLVHHSVIIELNIPSYRVEHAKKNQQAESQGEGEWDGGPRKN